MIFIFKHIELLSNEFKILIFLFIVSAFIIIPSYRKVFGFFKFLLRKQKLDLVFFRLESIPSRQINELFKESYDITNSNLCFFHGGPIVIIWKVMGAKRVDITNVGNDLTGNSAVTILDKEKNIFTLTATGFDGKVISKSIEIPSEDILVMNTFQYSSFFPNIHIKELSRRFDERQKEFTLNYGSICDKFLSHHRLSNKRKKIPLVLNNNTRLFYYNRINFSLIKYNNIKY